MPIKFNCIALRFFCFLSIALCLAGCTTSRRAAVADDNSIFWEISGNGLKHSSYLYGTIHLICKEDVIIPEKAKQAVKDADDVYFELDLDDPSASLKMMGSMKMQDGKTLKDVFTAEEYARVEKIMKDSFSISLGSMSQMKPFFLVSIMYPKMLACKKQSGIDQEFLKMAKEYKKPISGLESMEFQASVFDSIPYRVQAEELLKALDSMQVNRAQFTAMVNNYKKQDLNALRDLTTTENFGSDEFMDILLDKRNINWVGQLKKIMPEKKLFVAVGAGHLPGEKGLINLLRKEGFKVKPVK